MIKIGVSCTYFVTFSQFSIEPNDLISSADYQMQFNWHRPISRKFLVISSLPELNDPLNAERVLFDTTIDKLRRVDALGGFL